MTTKPKRPQRRSSRNIQNWRDVYQIHPAALLLPRMAEDELRTLGEDIKANGLHMPIVLAMHYPKLANGKIDQHKKFLGVIDGISRLDAMELVSLEVIRNGEFNRQLISVDEPSDLPDPFEYVLSINLHRRHLTSEQKRQTIEKAILAKPELSNSGLAKMLHRLATDKTIATVRRKMEGNSEILNKTERKEASGRKARGRKPGPATKRKKPVAFS